MKLGLRRYELPIVAVFLAALVGALVLLDAACTPAELQRLDRDARLCAPALVDGTCFVVRKAGAPPAATDACLTAQELADELAATVDAGRPAQIVVVAALSVSPARARKPAQRHCTSWAYVDGGSDDGGNSGRNPLGAPASFPALDGGDPRSPQGGGSVDGGGSGLDAGHD